MGSLFLLWMAVLASDVDVKRIDRELAEAFQARNAVVLSGGISRLGAMDSLDALAVVLRYYSLVEEAPEGTFSQEDRFRVFSVSARCVARATDRETVVAIPRMALSEKGWPARFLLIAGARANPLVDTVPLCIDVLARERHPVVAAEAVRTLGGSRSKAAILPLIEYWEGLQKKLGAPRPTVRARGGRHNEQSPQSPEWQRVPLALQEALTRLCGRVMHDPALYRTFVEAHGAIIDPSKPVHVKSEGRSVIFGLDVVGKNIAFVLDVSGSMEAIDPLPPGERPRGPRTGVRGDGTEQVLQERRTRMYRAREELSDVVRNLPEDRSFNIVAYASDVRPWQEHLVPAGVKQKRAALDFIASLKAQGITVTDWALEYAFQDPIVDTIYLITDGAPTHRGSAGPGLPEDAPRLIKEILQRARVLNYRRGVRIFTLGFPGAEEAFLQKLAEEHGGTYRPIR